MSNNFLNIIIDLSHHNSPVDCQKVAAGGVRAIIHKSTHGMTGRDETHDERRDAAREAKLLWGSYHFGTGVADGASQAKEFLQKTKPSTEDLLTLDLERNADGNGNPMGPNMTLQQAREFVQYIANRTGRYPMIYGGDYLKECLGDHIDPVLAQCPLWLAQYTSHGALPKWSDTWMSWTLWQYTGDGVGAEPHTAAGVGGVCERDYYVGTLEQLEESWSNNLQHQDVAIDSPHTFIQPTPAAAAAATPKTALRAEFHLQLKKINVLIRGNLVLFDAKDAKVFDVSATSGLAGHQAPGNEDIWFKEHGPLPPNPDTVTGNSISTSEHDSDIIPGKVFNIRPEAVTNPDTGVTRSAFRVHSDGGTPGSAGCIAVRTEKDFAEFRKIMAKLREGKISSIPLTLFYS